MELSDRLKQTLGSDRNAHYRHGQFYNRPQFRLKEKFSFQPDRRGVCYKEAQFFDRPEIRPLESGRSDEFGKLCPTGSGMQFVQVDGRVYRQDIACRGWGHHSVRSSEALGLFTAASEGYLEIIKAMVAGEGADVQRVLMQTNQQGRSCVHLAVMQHQPAVVDFVLSAAPQPEKIVDIADESLNTALHLACRFGEAWAVESMLSCISPSFRAAAILRRNAANDNVLHEACIHSSTQCLDHLLQLLPKVDVERVLEEGDPRGRTVFHIAAQRGSAACLRKLLSCTKTQSEVVSWKDVDGKTASEYAEKRSGESGMPRALVELRRASGHTDGPREHPCGWLALTSERRPRPTEHTQAKMSRIPTAFKHFVRESLT